MKKKPCTFPAKTNLQDHARLCKNLACKTCLPFSCTILAQSCTNSCKILQKHVQTCRCYLFCCKRQTLGIQLSKNELARSCKIVQESCMQDLLGTCTQYVPRFLHNLAHILQEMVQDFARDAARIITSYEQ